MKVIMHSNMFIHDMAIIMLVAGLVTFLFHRFKQPVVLGYLIAGIILGPHTPPITFIKDPHTVSTLAELGIVFLMFSLGLEFNLKKIAKVGARAIITAIIETSFMLFLGYKLGSFFGFSQISSIFLGSMLAISSTTIIVKALGELGLKQDKFAHLIFGILIVEDIIAIGLIAILSGLGGGGSIDGRDVLGIIGQLSLFIIVSLIFGLLLIPRLINYIAKFRSQEMLLVSTLGLCFGFALIVIALNYSIALGAFIIGAIIAESRDVHNIEKLIDPLKDMFCAIFFVSIGMMFDPKILIQDWQLILLISLTLILGKICGVSIASFLTGERPKTALKTGMGLAQIGEFSFVIALLGVSSKLTNANLYPVIIAVSAITTLTTPYLIKSANFSANFIGKLTPTIIKTTAFKYHYWMTTPKKGTGAENRLIIAIIAKISAQIIANCALVYSFFIAGAYIASHIDRGVFGLMGIAISKNIHNTIICSLALFVSLPFIIAAYRKLKALFMILAEFTIRESIWGKASYHIRQSIFEIMPLLVTGGIMSLILSVSYYILPPKENLTWILLIGVTIALVFNKFFIKIQSWLQIELFKVLNQSKL